MRVTALVRQRTDGSSLQSIASAAMGIPFTIEQFYGVFRAYNIGVWPAQWFLVLLGLAMVVLAPAPRRGSGVAVSAIL